jgi:hypothetical protein
MMGNEVKVKVDKFAKFISTKYFNKLKFRFIYLFIYLFIMKLLCRSVSDNNAFSWIRTKRRHPSRHLATSSYQKRSQEAKWRRRQWTDWISDGPAR